MATFDFDRMLANYDAVSSIANAGNAIDNAGNAFGGSGELLNQARIASQNGIDQQDSGMREMTGTERLFASLADLSNNIANSQRFGEYYQENGGLKSLLSPEGAARFAMNLPTGMASALPGGVANLYAAGTGSNVTYGADVANNMIQEKELDAGQRAASAVTGLVDTAGLMFGGSGSLINEFGRAMKAGRSVDAAARTGAGLNILRGTGSSLANRGALTTGQAFAFDVAEEAGEEFVQSLSEDVIQEQLNDGSLQRAFEGAVMGAAGGGLMSGAALGMRSLTNESIDKATKPPSQPEDKNVFGWYNEVNANNLGNGVSRATSGMSELARDESLKEYLKKKPGSASAMFKSTGTYQGFDDLGLTILEIRNIANQSQASYNDVLDWVNGGDRANGFVTPQQLNNWLLHNNDASAQEMWTKLQEVYGDNEIRVALERNPGTSEGIVWARVKGIKPGKGIDLSPHLAKAVGGDYDSDRGAVFFDITQAQMNPITWASDLLQRNEDQSGTSPSTKYDFDFTSMVYATDDDQRSHQRDTVTDRLTDLTRIYSGGVGNTALVDNVVNDLFNAYEITDNDARNVAIAQALTRLKQQFDTTYGADGSGRAGRDAVSTVFESFADYYVPQSADALAKTAAEEAFNRVVSLVNRKGEGGVGGVATPGSSTSTGTAFSSFEAGMPDWFTAENLQQFYRSYATAIYQNAKREGLEQQLFSETHDVHGVQISAWGMAIIEGAKLVTAGTDPSDAIVEITSELIRIEYAKELGDAHLATSDPAILEERIKKFEEIYQKWAKVKNESMKQLRGELYMTPAGTAEWNESLTFTANRSQFCSEYLRIFGSGAGSELIPPEYFGNGSSSFADQLKDLNSIVLNVAQHGLSAGSLIVMSNKNEGDYSLYNLFMGLVDAVKSEGPRTTAAAREILGEVDLRGLMQRYVAGEDLRPEDIAAWMKYSEVLESLANKKAWMYAGLIDPKNWINTAIGRKLTSTDVDDRLTAIVAANFLGKFRDALAFRANPDNNGKQFPDKIENKLEELANIDILHRQIVNELRSEGTENEGRARSDTLERLLDLDTTFDEKERWISNVLGAEDGTMEGSLLLSSMQSAVEEDVLYLDKSTSTQIRQARTAASEYKMLLWDNAVAEVEELETYVKKLQNQEVFRTVFYEQCAKAVTSISLDPLCSMIADGANFSNHQPEKGTTIYSSSHYYVQVDFAENGNQTSFLTDKFSTPLGTALLEDVLSNPQIILRLLSDPDISLRVFAHDGRNCVLTRDAVYEHVCGPNYQRKTGPTVDNTLELLRAYPTLVTYLGGIDTSSRDGNGGPNDVKSRQNTLLNLMKNEAQRRTDNREGDVERHAFDLQIAKIKNALLGDMRTASYVFSCLSPETKTNVERGFRPSKAEVDSILTRMAKGIYAERARAYTQDGKQLTGASVTRFNRNFMTGFLDRMQKFTSLVDRGIVRNASQSLRYADEIKSQQYLDVATDETFFMLLQDYGDEAGLDLGPGNLFLSSTRGKREKSDIATRGNVTSLSDLVLLYNSLSSMILGDVVFSDRESLENTLKTLVASWVGAGDIQLKPGYTQERVVTNLVEALLPRYQQLSDMLIPVDGTLFDAQGHKKGPDALDPILKQIAKICNDEGSSDEAYRNTELRNRFDALPDNAQHQDYMSFALLLNSAIVNRVVNNYQENISGAANPAIARDYANAYDYVSSFISDPRYLGLFDEDELISSQHLEKYLHNRGYDGAIDAFPIPDYSDRKSALYARQLIEIASSGRVLTEVGRNGMENAELFGIDLVPLKPIPFVTGEVTTWGDLKAKQEPNIDRRYVRKLENGQPTDDQPITIGELKALQQGPADTDQYELFDPKINPHGVHLGPLMAPAMGAYANGYKGIIAALNRMQMESMEEMVLKVRKAFGKNGDFTLVRIRDNGSTRRDGLNHLWANRISTTDAARKAYEEFVEAATDVIANSSLYTSELKSIGIGRDEFRALVQMMTPAIDVHYKENGQHKHKLIDVMHLYSGDYETELKKIPGEIVDAEVFNVTLQVAARKIEDGVITVNNDMTDDEFSQAAYDQMTNWDNFESGTLSIGEVLAQVPALGRSYNNLHAEGDMTAFQSMYKKVMGVEFPNFSRNTPSSLYKEYRWGKKIQDYASDPETMTEAEKTHWNARETVSKKLSYVSGSVFKNAVYGVEEEGQPVNICRVFGSDFSWTNGQRIDSVLKSSLETLSNSDWTGNSDNVLLLSKDDHDLERAIAFAVEAKKDILMPVALFNGYDADLQHTTLSFAPYSGTRAVNGEFIVIPYTEMTVAPHARFGGSRARIQRVNPQTFWNTILLDDRGEFPGIGDSVTRFLIESASKLGTWGVEDARTVNLSSFIKPKERAYYGFSLIDESDIASLKNISVSDNKAWEKFDEAIKQIDRSEHESTKKQGGVSRLNGYRGKIKDCIDAMAKNAANGRDLSRPLAGREGGDCATIIKVTDRSGSVVRYIPVMIPKNVGKIGSGSVIYSNGDSNVGISYTEKVDYSVNGYAKWNIATEAAVKSVLSFVEDLGRSGCAGFDGVTNFSTLSSRLKGRDTSVAYTNIHRKMIQEYMHFLFEYNESTGKVELASWMRDRHDGEYISNTLHSVTTENSLWADILGGKLPADLMEGEDPENLGRVLRKVIVQSQRHGIPIMNVFGAGNFSVDLTEGKNKYQITIAEDQWVPDIAMAFDGLSFGDVIDFFAYIGQNQAKPLVQFRNDPQEAGEKSNFIFDKTGKMQVKIGDRICYRRVFVGPVQYMGHASGIDTPGNEATVSIQQRNNKIAMYGIDSSSVEYAAAYARWHRLAPEAFNITRDVNLNNIVDLGFDALNISGPLFDSWEEANNLATLRDRADTALRWRRKIVKNDGSEEVVNLAKDDDRIKTAIEDFGKKIGWKKGVIPIGLVHYLVNAKDGSTKGNLENQTIKTGRFIDLLEEIAEDYKKSGRRTLIWQDPDAISADRIALPVLDESVVDYICNNTDMKKADYVEAMWEAEANSLNCIQALTDPKYGAKQAELRAQSAANRLGWDDAQHPWNDVGYLFAGVTIDDIKRSDGLWSKFLKAKGFDEEGFDKLSEYGQTLLKDQYKKLHLEDTRKTLESDKFLGAIGRSGKSVQTSDQVTKVMRNTISLSRLMAVANPGVAIGNLAGRATSQSAMELFLNIGARYKIGPMSYGAENALSSDVMTKINQDEALHKTWNTLRKISLLGDDLEAISRATSSAKLLEELDKVTANQTTFQKFATRGFDFANGGEFLTKQQTRLFFKRLVQFMSAEPALNVYFQKVPDAEGNLTDMTLIEREILSNPSAFLLDCFNKGGRPELYACAQQAMNSALTGDMAQRHFLASWLHHLASQTTFGDFILSTTICKFPKYQFNLVGKYMQWFAPMSTTYMLLTRAAQKIDEKIAEHSQKTGGNYTPYHFELDQRFVNVREAMAYDMTHMGAAPLAAILAMLGNAFEPPEDEKKWGDPDEWLFCGARVGESWWLTDMLGAFIPSILWIRSCIEGNPTSALLVNGTMSACYGNPFLRAADCVNVLLDWDDGTLMDYQHTAELYKDAEGGAPGFLDWIQSNTAAGLANWATSLVTPSIVKEIYRNSEAYERSYNRVYQTTNSGKLSEAGEAGYTEKTNYQDAMLRKFCRSNPLMAVALDLLHPGAPTGYLLSEMPYTIYTDPSQAEQAKAWSVSGKDEKEADALMWEIFYYMDARTPEEMQSSGFYLDKETLYAFGSWLWDAYYRIEDEWTKRGANGELSYTVLGNGDYEKGKQVYNELLNDKKQSKQKFYDMYYDKVRGSYLNKGMQTYRRYATSYRTDSEGNLYATGFHRQGVLPFLSAPGTLTDPEGTAGYENDFQSISPVTGQPMGERALVAVESESMDLPAFEGFSAKGDGNGYSGKWSNYAKYESPTTTYTPSGYRSSGGGSSRRSSGSSSQYVPGISSRNYTPNIPNAATARTTRVYDTQFDYLRPGVETKGSRDAYKRGDI